MSSPAQTKIREWRRDPVRFVRDNFRVEPDAWQIDALRAAADPGVQRVSMQACVGPGKTAVLAWIGWWRLSCFARPNRHPKGYAVAVTADHLRDNLWPELRVWQNESPFLQREFVWQKQRIFARAHPDTWFLAARSWPKAASPEDQGKTLSGLHGLFPFVLVDESGSIPPTVLRAGEQALATCEDGLFAQAGNPMSRDGMLYAASSQLAHQWHVVRVTGDPDDPKRSPRVDREWAAEQIRQYGRDDPWVKAHILGEFPPASFNTLLSPDQVREAMARGKREHEIAGFARILGVDVAREGDDRSVIFPRQGPLALEPIILRGVDSLQGAGAVARKWGDWNASACFIDNTGGFGAGWLDQLKLLQRHATGIHFAGAPLDARYANKRAEMWYEMAQWVKQGGALPNLPELVAELSEPLYTFHGDRLLLEDKAQVKKRLGRSPDLGDALALTFAMPVVPPSMRDELGLSRQPAATYDEFGFGGSP